MKYKYNDIIYDTLTEAVEAVWDAHPELLDDELSDYCDDNIEEMLSDYLHENIEEVEE